MKTYIRQELSRLISTMPETDPTSREYLQLLQNIEYLIGIGGTLEEFVEDANTMQFASGVTACEPMKVLDRTMACDSGDETPPVASEVNTEDKVIPEVDSSDTEPSDAIDEQTMKNALIDIRRRKKINVCKLIQDNFGVNSFDEMPKKKYPELMAIIKKIDEE